jgi:hypothetical protein
MLDGLSVRRPAEREVTSLEPVIDGGVNKAGFREVARHDFIVPRGFSRLATRACAPPMAIRWLLHFCGGVCCVSGEQIRVTNIRNFPPAVVP